MVADGMPFSTVQRVATNLITPPIDLSNTTNPRLEFYYHMFGNQITKLDVRVREYGSTTWTLIENINANSTAFTQQSDPWLRHVDSLSNWAGDTIEIMFSAVRSVNNAWNSNSRIAIDDIRVEEAPTCDFPANLFASAIRFDRVTLNWSSFNASPIAYEVQYAPGTSGPSNGTIVSLSAPGSALTGLSANTTYSARVREVCAAGDTSAWTSHVVFKTHCSPAIAPFTENFDGSNWAPASNWNQQGTYPSCWIDGGNASQFWTAGPPAFSWAQTGPSADHTTGSDQYMFMLVNSSVSQTGNPRMHTRWIDLDTLSAPEVRLWYHAFGQNMGTLKLYAQRYDGTTGLLWTQNGGTHSSSTAPWTEKIMSLNSFKNDTIRLVFEYSFGTGFPSFFNQFAIDDLFIGNEPSCPQPSSLLISAIGTYVAQLGWTSGGASNYQIRYREKGNSIWSWTTAAQASVAIGGLSSATTYEWQVRDSCGSGDVSFWAYGPDFTTNCGIYTAPYTESFSDGSKWVGPGWPDQDGSIDQCWNRMDTTDYFWTGATSGFNHYFGTGPSGDHTSGSGGYVFARSGTPFTSSANTVLRTPIIDMDTLQTPILEFWYHMFGSEVEKLEVFIWSKKTNTVSKIYTLNGQQQTANTANWKKAQLNLTNYEGDTIQVRFKAFRSGSGFTSFRAAIAIDDVQIMESPVCPTPVVSSSNITYNSADISWTGWSNNTAYEYGVQGYAPGTGTRVGTSLNTASLTGLLANTTYAVRVKDTCSSNLTSIWGVHTFTTLPCPPIIATGQVTLNGTTVDAHSLTAVADSVFWDWDDGTFTSDSSASHTFTTFGAFDIMQIVFNECGSSDTLIHPVSFCAPLSASFAFNSTFLTVDFDGSASSGTAIVLSWDYGDGQNGTGVNPTHTYATNGTYTVVLTVQDSCGSLETYTAQIQVCDNVNLGFSTTAIGNDFTFTATPATLTNYTWDFGDGNSGSGLNTSNTYVGNGTFTVTLTAEDDCGNIHTFIDDVATCDPVTGDFSFTIVSTSANGMVVQFMANSPNATSYRWYWGDGTNNVSSTPNIQHLYPVVSLNYTVTCLMINQCADTLRVVHRLTEVGVDETELAPSIYPNPSTGLVNLEFAHDFNGTVSCYDLQGRLLRTVNAKTGNSVVLDLSSLPKGMYELRWIESSYQGRTTVILR
jgi:PKD repeat protein